MSLLQMSISGAVMVLAVIIIRALAINRLPKKTFIVLWGIVLLRLLVPFSFPSPFSAYSFIKNHITTPQGTAGGIDILPVSPVIAPIAGGALQGQTTASGSPYAVVWVIGMIACALFFAVSYFKCRREFRESLPVKNDFLIDWLAEHKLIRPIEIRQSSRISAPLTYGIFKPIILMPKNTKWEDTKQIEYILAHEFVHVRRFDAAGKLLLTVALCIHWFNPLVWVMYILSNRDIELACDEAVVRSFGEPAKSAYARTLISMEEKKSTLTPLCNNFSKNAIEERIKAIMKIKKTSIIAVFIAIVLIAGVTTAFATSATASNEAATTSTIIPEDNFTPSVSSSQPPEQTDNSLENYDEYRTLGIDYNNESGRFYIDGELVKYLEDKALDRYFGAYTDGKYNVYAVRNADGKLTGFDILNWTNNELDIKYREYTDFGLKFQKTDSNGLELYGKPISSFSDVAVGVGISRKNGGDGVEYQAVRDTLDPGPTGKGRLIDIKPVNELREATAQEQASKPIKISGKEIAPKGKILLGAQLFAAGTDCKVLLSYSGGDKLTLLFTSANGSTELLLVESGKAATLKIEQGGEYTVSVKNDNAHAISNVNGTIEFMQSSGLQSSNTIAGLNTAAQTVTYKNVEMRRYEGSDGHPYIHDAKANKTAKKIVGCEQGMLAFDKDGKPLKIDWWSLDTKAESSYFYLNKASSEIAPDETYDVFGGWSLNFYGTDLSVEKIAYVLYCDKKITFADGTVWINPNFDSWRATYEGKKVDVNILKSYYPYEQKVTFSNLYLT